MLIKFLFDDRDDEDELKEGEENLCFSQGESADTL